MSQGYPSISSVTSTVGAEAANAITVSYQFKGEDGQDATERLAVLCYLSSDAAGDTPVAAQTSMAVGTDGSELAALVAEQTNIFLTEADGDLDVVVTDTGTSTRYLHIVDFGTGKIIDTATLPFA